MAILSSDPTELGNSSATWGNRALGLEFLSFGGGRVVGSLILSDRGAQRISGVLFLIAVILGFVAAIFAIIGVFRDTRKWPGVLAIVLFPLTVIYTV
jgi:hypothetical protein